MRLFSFLVVIGAAAGVFAQKTYKFGEPVELKRVYFNGESQEYMLNMTITMESAGGTEIKATAEFALAVEEVLANGDAEVEQTISDMSISLGGEAMPGMPMPEPKSMTMGPHGMPLSIDFADAEDPLALVFPAFYLPSATINIGDEFDVEWSAEDGKFELEGSGKLVATGRLYEEHVAKITYDLKAAPEGESPGSFTLTTYTNSETGKLVKAVGEIEAEDPDMGGKFKAEFTIEKERGL